MVLQLTDFTSEITDEELLEFTSEYYIPFALHPVVPAASASIADFPEGKVGVYTRFFEFANQPLHLEDLPQQPMKNQGITKVDLLVCEVGLKWESDGFGERVFTLFVCSRGRVVTGIVSVGFWVLAGKRGLGE
ncbi:hypothetical protein Tco_0952561 [Tanacetum coccineum]|uniref:Uncharacterized protein n=1 Tax=Tanacetum coccineum TaxID=301880 RepID=A0ABQ5E075_9ASTR